MFVDESCVAEVDATVCDKLAERASRWTGVQSVRAEEVHGPSLVAGRKLETGARDT